MNKPLTAAITLLAGTVLLAAPEFKNVWKSPDAAQVSFAGKKVAALLMTQDDSLRVSGEESLVTELTTRGLQAVATYRMAPKEELQSADRARGWFERANVDGVIALRPVSSDTRTVRTPSMWVSPSYSTLWGYYGYGWGSVYVPGSIDRDTVVTVEMLIYSVPRNQLLWAAVTETKNPKSLQRAIADLVKEAAKELQKQGLVRK